MGDAPQQAVRDALKQALASHAFAQSERQRNLLRYLVEATLAGTVPKETIVGIEVYGRGPDFDPKQDSIVRVEASRLRQRLAAYYIAEGSAETIRIELPRGSYRCEFVTPSAIPSPASPPRPQRTLWWAAAAVVLLFAAILAGWSNRPSTDRPEDISTYLEAHRLLRMPVDEHVPTRVRQAVGLLEQAATLEDASPRVHSALAEAYLSLADYEPQRTAELNNLAETSARKAIAADDRLDDAHHTLAATLFFNRWNLQAALDQFNRAVELNPRRAPTQRLRADILCILGRFNEAVQALEKAQLLQPEQAEIGAERALVYYHWRRYDQAVTEASRVLSMQPGFAPARWVLGLAYQQQGRLTEAEKEFRSLPTHPRRYSIALAHLLTSSRRVPEAQHVARQIEATEPYPYLHVILEAASGNKQTTLYLLEQAAARRDINVLYAGLDPRLDLLRDSPDFQSLLRTLGRPAQ